MAAKGESREVEKLRGKIASTENEINNSRDALRRHNRNEFGYEFVENKPMSAKIDSLEKRKDMLQRELDKAQNKKK